MALPPLLRPESKPWVAVYHVLVFVISALALSKFEVPAGDRIPKLTIMAVAHTHQLLDGSRMVHRDSHGRI